MTELLVWAVMVTAYFTGLIALILVDPSDLKGQSS